jgi:hypothetical protein
VSFISYPDIHSTKMSVLASIILYQVVLELSESIRVVLWRNAMDIEQYTRYMILRVHYMTIYDY